MTSEQVRTDCSSPGPTEPQAPMNPAPEPEVAQQPQVIRPWKRFIGCLVPDWLLHRWELSPGAKLCYARLLQHVGKNDRCWPGQRTLAAELGVSDRHVRTHLNNLKRLGLIGVTQTGLRKTNVYTILRHPWMPESQASAGCSAQDGNEAASRDGNGSADPDGNERSDPILEKNQKEIDSKRVYSLRRQGIPFDEDEAITSASQFGVPADFALRVFRQMRSVGWLDGCRRPINSWPDHIQQRWQKEEAKADRSERNLGKTGERKPSIFELEKKLKMTERLIEKHAVTYHGMFDANVTDEERANYFKLARNRDQLEKQIADAE